MRKSKRRDHLSQQVNGWVLIVMALLLLASTAFLAFVRPTAASDKAETSAFSVWLDGPAQAQVDQVITYSVTTDAEAVYGAQFDISFDPAVLQVIDEGSGTNGIQITPGVCPAPDFVVENSADNTLGAISYAATSLSPTPPCDGGIIATFRFKVLQPGTTQVLFDDVILANSDGLQIPAAALDLTLEVDYLIYLPVIIGS